MLSEATLQHLTGAALGAGTPAAWDAVIGDVREAFGAGSAVLRSPGGDTSLWIDAGVGPQVRADYGQRWHALDPWACSQDGHQSSRTGRCFIGRQIVPERDVLASPFYADFGRQHGLKEVLSILVDDGEQHGPGSRAILALFRAEGQPDFVEQDRRALIALQPSLRSALLHYHRVGAFGRWTASLRKALDAVPQAIYLLRPDAWIEHQNAAADSFATNPLIATSAGRLTRVGTCGGVEFERFVRAAALGLHQSFGAFHWDDGQLRTASVHLSSLGDEAPFSAEWPQARVMVTLQPDDHERIVATRIRALAAECGLTAVEIQVLRALCHGQSVEAVAQARGLKLTTVRTHVRHLLQKTQCERQSDLIRLARG